VADIRPFRGILYNQSLLKNGLALICPPHDIINPQQQQELYQRSEYNFVRLELGWESREDTGSDNRYTRAAATLEQWLRQGVLETAEVPAIYLYDQYFTHQGRRYKRRSLTARVRLEEWSKMVIRPHENTMSQSRSDRLSLLLALQANTSPILALYEDLGARISPLLTKEAQNKPLINLKSDNGEGHTVWAITEPAVINQISRTLAGQPLYIADGHHRYESALAYQRARSAAST